MTDLENVVCNNCHNDNTRLLFVKNGFNIVTCTNCGLVYTNPRVKRDHAQKVYGSAYFKSTDSIVSGYDDYLKERPTIEATFKKRVEYIINKAPSLTGGKGLYVLDIGCAMGFLLNIFRNMGWNSEGVEFSEFASLYAKNELSLNVRQGTLNNLEFPEIKYDLVTSWDVIEHSYNPKEDLQIINRITKKGGYIAIITPDRESLHSRIVGQKWVEYEKPEEHLYFFGKNTLIKILDDIGFDLVSATTAGKYVSVGFAFNRLNSYSRIFGSMGKLFGKRLAERYIYINPRDKMFLLARKR
jgi:2-polyprenyl-3-methyl-5-hydroxy-6-metoxy-1,4-benzoquinol methylase